MSWKFGERVVVKIVSNGATRGQGNLYKYIYICMYALIAVHDVAIKN